MPSCRFPIDKNNDYVPRRTQSRRNQRNQNAELVEDDSMDYTESSDDTFSQTNSDSPTDSPTLPDRPQPSLLLDEQALADDDDYNKPLYDGSNISIRVLLSMILHIIVERSPTKALIEDILDLLKMVLPEGNLVPKTFPVISNFMKHEAAPVTFKKIHYCGTCYLPFQHSSNNPKENYCTNCQSCDPQNQSFFVHFSISNYIQDLFSTNKGYNKLQYRFHRKSQPNVLQDIYDGKQYKKWISKGFLNQPQNISFTLNTDGVAPFQSAKKTMWPVFLVVNELPPSERYKKSNMILAGLWMDKVKPPMNAFLMPIIDELHHLQTSGVAVKCNNEELIVQAVLLNCVCDSPAKAAVLNIKSCNGKAKDDIGGGGCPYCKHPGEWIDNRTVYPYLKGYHKTCKRKQKDRDLGDDLSIKGPTILSALPDFDVIKNVSVDSMHSVWEGVVKLMISLWFDATHKDAPWSLRTHVQEIDRDILKIKLSSDHLRQFRSVNKEACYWKAVECKNFCLIAFPAVMKPYMDHDYYEHFLNYADCMSVLYSDSISQSDLVAVQNRLEDFVDKFEKLYSPTHMTFNVHVMLHICDSVANFGPLWTHSCFPFENYNSILTCCFHGTRWIIEQVSWYLHAQRVYQHHQASLFCIKPRQLWKFTKTTPIQGGLLIGTLQTPNSPGQLFSVTRYPAIDVLLQQSRVQSIQTCQRVFWNNQFYNTLFKDATQKINNHTIELVDGRFALIEYFIHLTLELHSAMTTTTLIRIIPLVGSPIMQGYFQVLSMPREIIPIQHVVKRVESFSIRDKIWVCLSNLEKTIIEN